MCTFVPTSTGGGFSSWRAGHSLGGVPSGAVQAKSKPGVLALTRSPRLNLRSWLAWLIVTTASRFGSSFSFVVIFT